MPCSAKRWLCAAAFLLASEVWAQASNIVPIPDDPNVRILEQLADPPDGRIDYTKVQAAIERMVDPSFNEVAFNAELDHWASQVRAQAPKGATPTQMMTALGQVIYVPGPWNDERPFSYDLNDPMGTHDEAKLVSYYLRTRKGNCVSMPTLLILLGQKLGLVMTLSQAPQHEFARLQDASGRWFNIEATSPGSPPDSKYIDEMRISQRAIQSGIYLRTTTPRETVAAMLDPLLGIYAHNRPPGYLLGLAKLVQRVDPKNFEGYVFEANAYFLELGRRYLRHNLTPEVLPPAQRADFKALLDANARIINQVKTMGWAPPTDVDDAAYLRRVQRYKAEHGG